MSPTSQELRILWRKRQRIERLQMDYLRTEQMLFKNGAKDGKRKRVMSIAGRKRIAKAQRKRWAAYHSNHQTD